MKPLRLRYQTIEFGSTDIHLRTLRNRQEFSDPNDYAAKLGIGYANWSLFGVVWASGEILAKIMSDHDVAGKRILEVGCGIGLASLLLNDRKANITATDHHPAAEQFLAENTHLNNGEPIPFVRTGWADEITDLGQFDLIIGSDLLYERNHAEELASFIDQHATEHCEVIIIDPGRSHHSKFSKKMVSLGYSHRKEAITEMETISQPTRNCSQFSALYYQR